MGLMQSYALFKNYFSPHKMDQKIISELKISIEKEKMKTIVLQNQIFDFQQEVAATLPSLDSVDRNPSTFQVRNLASISQKPLLEMDLSGSLSQKAKSEFRQGEYSKAIESFKLLNERYPTSPLIVESYFLLGESYFLKNDVQECMDIVEHMMNHYPEHELTGFLMLRMGQVFQSQGRSDEAREVFRVVSQKFAFNQELKKQAEQLEKSSD